MHGSRHQPRTVAFNSFAQPWTMSNWLPLPLLLPDKRERLTILLCVLALQKANHEIFTFAL